MKKKSTMLEDFNFIVDKIKARKKLTPEEEIIWKQCLKKIEDDLDKPVDTEVIVPTKYKLSPTISWFKKIRNWF